MQDENSTRLPIRETNVIKAQAEFHHAFLLGLQLMISTNRSNDVVGDWMFRLFRRQHHDKFLSSFKKLGLEELPHAVACARYHAMSNSVGGVPVEYMFESDQKAWVRFRYPRWMYYGPTICGVPLSVSRGFLEGWYAHNGVSLNNPRLGFVCVSEDMTGEFGLCGYFKEHDHDLDKSERLQFAKDELPPVFNPEQQPELPSDQWNNERLQKANRNYAIDYIRNGLIELRQVIGTQATLELGSRAARLIGLQYMPSLLEQINGHDGDLETGASFLCEMFNGMGDSTQTDIQKDGIQITHGGLRIVRGIEGEDRELLLAIWAELWKGAMMSFRQMKRLSYIDTKDELIWKLEAVTERTSV